MLSQVVVVGASAAGLTAAEALRREGFAGELTVIGDEVHPPYDRPPLSKQILRGGWEPDRIVLRTADLLADLKASWLLGTPAAGLDPVGRKVVLADGREIGYDGLVIATGATPRRLPFGHDVAGVHLLRTLDDTLALRDGLRSAGSVAIVGAGFLGAEVAAVAREARLEVTMIDPLPAPMIRQFGAELAGLLAQLHQSRGVNLRCGVGVTALTGDDGRVTGVDLSDGSHVTADLVLVAIGAIPATTWLAGSGLSLGDGVECDQYCVAAPGIVAAGDVASWHHPGIGRRRLEHRMNATEQATIAAKNLLGAQLPFAPVSYFWTDQYDVKLQVYGRSGDDLDFRIVAGTPTEDRFAALYGNGHHVTGALTWNLPRQARLLRTHVANQTPWQEALASIPTGELEVGR
ncbi:NAD/ferredoxin-dependent reductase-like protein [Kribbella voronezhensis]|uniref:NAD/ferredoxin-dependent reductase-like protein n=1 Tax=Kribbella voronezhensis TaxID=2512212 RepID=A0A4R7T9H5_9ACTN|nr:FAD-dependent oxidoreductase [Kribbella voronezhensis]TDU87847.1 NAD/ferredoxin-dependent reductase-like protein [Kribbella voronezhensis]